MLNCQLPLTRAVVGLVPERSKEFGTRAPPQPDQCSERFDPISPGQLLAFLAAACVVADRHLMDAVTKLEDASGDLRFNVETVALQVEPLPELCAQHLVAGLH